MHCCSRSRAAETSIRMEKIWYHETQVWHPFRVMHQLLGLFGLFYVLGHLEFRESRMPPASSHRSSLLSLSFFLLSVVLGGGACSLYHTLTVVVVFRCLFFIMVCSSIAQSYNITVQENHYVSNVILSIDDNVIHEFLCYATSLTARQIRNGNHLRIDNRRQS